MLNEAMRLGIGEDVVQLDARQARVQRNGDGAEPGTRIHQLDVLRFVRKQDRQSIARSKALPAQRGGDVRDTIVELAKGYSPAIRNQRGSFRTGSSRAAERMCVNHALLVLKFGADFRYRATRTSLTTRKDVSSMTGAAGVYNSRMC